jgi:hypothetical protein
MSHDSAPERLAMRIHGGGHAPDREAACRRRPTRAPTAWILPLLSLLAAHPARPQALLGRPPTLTDTESLTPGPGQSPAGGEGTAAPPMSHAIEGTPPYQPST